MKKTSSNGVVSVPAGKEEAPKTFVLNEKYYGYIKAHREKLYPLFHIALSACKNPFYVEFLDVGCGAGNVLLSFEAFIELGMPSFARPYIQLKGIEYNPRLVEAARLHDLYPDLTDAFAYKHYNKADIIYYYHPIKDRPLQKELEILIEDNARMGTVFIAPLRENKLRPGFSLLCKDTWNGTSYSNAVVYIKGRKK